VAQKSKSKPLDTATEKLPNSRIADELHTDRLIGEVGNLVGALGNRALSSVIDRVEDATDRLTDYAENGGPGLMAAVTGAKKLDEGKSGAKAALGAGISAVQEKVKQATGRGGGGRGKKLKLTNIVETIDVGAPVDVAYDQWAQFADFPSFMKKVGSVAQESDEKLHWKAQIFWSRREWDATIVDQVPDQRIVWRSKGQKGRVDGAVTFHDLTPDLTRIVLVLEYHPKGLFERTGNLWRAQGRRVRLELKHFQRHVMTQTILHPEKLEGWRGTIRDGQVVEEDETTEPDEQESQEQPADEEAEQEGYGEDDPTPDEDEAEEYDGHEDEQDASEPERMSRPRRRRTDGERTGHYGRYHNEQDE
jgi:uncharacterized membrane protein